MNILYINFNVCLFLLLLCIHPCNYIHFSYSSLSWLFNSILLGFARRKKSLLFLFWWGDWVDWGVWMVGKLSSSGCWIDRLDDFCRSLNVFFFRMKKYSERDEIVCSNVIFGCFRLFYENLNYLLSNWLIRAFLDLALLLTETSNI